MREIIKNFAKQFEYEPEIHNGHRLGHFEKFLVSGMGGSNLVAGLLQNWHPEADVIAHRDYGLPSLSAESWRDRLVVVISYSGNTEEAISSLEAALRNKLPVVAIAAQGKLLELAEKYGIPHVRIPDASLPPRTATGLMMRAFIKIISRDSYSAELATLAQSLQPALFEKKGMVLAGRLNGFVPVVYASLRNQAVAYNWKIKLNETGKVPAFTNIFPELNHNEMNGFSAGGGSAFGGDVHSELSNLTKSFRFIFLEDSEDDLKIKKRMQTLKRLLERRSFVVESVPIQGHSRIQAIFSSLVLADWTALYLAETYGVDPVPVPMVEEFKKLI